MDNPKINIDDLRKRMDKENGRKSGKVDIDQLRYDEMIDAQIEQYRNKGKMTIQDIMALQQLEDMKWERRQRMKAESQPATTVAPQIDIEDIIKKATEPLNEQIREMKRQQEKQEEERKWDNIQKQIDKLTDLFLAGGKRKDEDDPILQELAEMRKQLHDEQEKARKKDEEDFRTSMKDMIYNLTDEIAEMKAKPHKSQSEVEQIIEAEKKRGELLKALGVKNEKEDEASMLDVADSLIDKVPKWAKTASTVREVFSKDSEIPDDIPDNVPTNLPQRNEPIPQRSAVPEDIKEFLDRGRVERGTYIDYAGTPWVNLEGNPISRRDIEDLAITNPDDVRRLMNETDEAYRKQQEKKQEQPQPKAQPRSPAKPRQNTDFKNTVHTPAPPEPAQEDDEEEDDTPAPAPAAQDNDESGATETDDLRDALAYIYTGNDVDDGSTGKVWVGQKNEFYTNDDGKPATQEDLERMARENPKEFMHDVRQHLASLDEEGNNNGN